MRITLICADISSDSRRIAGTIKKAREMKGDGRFTLTSALLTTILLLYAATGGGDAKPQQGPKFYDPSTGRRVQKTQGRPSCSVGSSWAVEVSGGEPENAELLARKHGLTNHGQVSNLIRSEHSFAMLLPATFYAID